MPSYELSDKGLRRSLNLNILAISFGMVFYTVVGNPIGSPIFTGFMRMLGAGELVYSIVLALPVLGAVTQVFGAYLLETTGKRKFIILSSGLINRVLWIPVALIPLLLRSSPKEVVIWSLTILITASSVSVSFLNVAFVTWMGDLVPSEIQGRYFGLRSLASSAVGAVSAILIGAFIDAVNNMIGFAIVFLIGAVFGIAEIACYFFVRHPPMTRQK